jgi:two-component system phosphate regulon response regulator PhoB
MEALREMFAWEESDFALGETGTPSAPRTIEDPWPAVLRRMLGPVPSARRKRAIERPLSQFKPKLALAPTVTNVVKDGSKVVIIDDTETLLDFVAEMLAAADPRMQIVTATNATDGLAACVAHRPDLILVDYCLPDFNGDEVCRRLLARDETRAIPVIMMSGHVAQMAATAAGFENVVFTLAKPFLSAAMVDVVRKSLANPPQIKPRPATTEVKASALAPPVQTAPEIANGERKTSEKKPHSEPPAPTPIPPPPSAPASAVPCATATVGFEVPVSAIVAEPGPSAQVSLTPAHLATTRSDAVVVSLALEIISMQFSPALQITAIRARPSSMIVSMQVDGRAAPSLRLPEAAFEMDRVNLGGRGEIETMQLAPSGRRLEALIAGSAVAIGHCAVLPSNGSGALQLTPATTAPVPIQLLMAFDLAGVELSPTFSLSHLALKARGRKVRVILPGQSGNVGVIFESAHVLLNHSALISEILLDSVVS